MRLDKYLKVSRLIKRRTVANEVADAAGALLFAAVQSIRLAGLDAEEALTFASKAFCARLEGARPQTEQE